MTTAAERMIALGPAVQVYLSGKLTDVLDEPPALAEGERLRRQLLGLSKMAAEEMDHPALDAHADGCHAWSEQMIAAIDAADRGDVDATTAHLKAAETTIRSIVRAARQARNQQRRRR